VEVLVLGPPERMKELLLQRVGSARRDPEALREAAHLDGDGAAGCFSGQSSAPLGPSAAMIVWVFGGTGRNRGTEGY
jgi:hypothetical protein